MSSENKPVEEKPASLAFGIFVLLSALSISVTAAYYSIIGLMAIFSGAAVAVATMGAVLETGKLVAASWLHNNWHKTKFLMKSYLTIAVMVLMLITSIGIFGFLSKAHLEQVGPKGNHEAKITKIDFDINQQEKRIERANQILGQFDKALEVYFQKEYVTRGLKERAKQKEEREALQEEIRQANETIDKLNEEKFESQKEVLGIEAEVGPIKYIADFALKDTSDKALDKAVQYMIILLIFVFDPVAVLLVLAANISINEALDYRRTKKNAEVRTEAMNKALDEVIAYTEEQDEDEPDIEIVESIEDVPEQRKKPPVPKEKIIQKKKEIAETLTKKEEEPQVKIVEVPVYKTKEVSTATIEKGLQEAMLNAGISFNITGPEKTLIINSIKKNIDNS